jgi:hypothetical protein
MMTAFSGGNGDDRGDGALTTNTTAILDHVIWIVAQLDADGLQEIRNVPVLELAKHISVAGRAAA